MYSGRTSRSALGDSTTVAFNGSTSSFTSRYIEGNGATASSATDTRYFGSVTGATTTASTFSNVSVYIPNYTSSNNKSYSIDSTVENNGTTAFAALIAGLWSNTAAINQITITLATGSTTFVQYSTFYLYGIKKD